MNPEQFRSSDVEPSSDLYSAALVLYEMLTGNLPFKSETPLMVALNQLNCAPASVASPGRAIQNAALDSFFAQALNKECSARFNSAEEMLKAFHAASQQGIHSRIAPTKSASW